MNYAMATKILNNNGYNAVPNILEHGNNNRELLYVEVEVSPFSVINNVQKIKVLLPDFNVESLGSNSGVGRISIKMK